MLLLPGLNGEMPVESSLAGGNGNGGTQLPPDDGGVSSLAGGGTAAEWPWRFLQCPEF
jgi:hypothetical protein